MKRSVKDKAVGAIHEAKGKLVQRAGKLLADPALEAEGRHEKVAGEVQQVIGAIEHVVGE